MLRENGFFFVYGVVLLEADLFAGEELDVLALENLGGAFGLGGFEDDRGVLFDLGDEGVDVFDVDGAIGEGGHDFGQAAGLVVDLHGQHIGNGDGAAGGFEGVAGFLRVADDEAQDAELGGIGYGNSADVDMVLAENIGDVRHAALFVFDKDRDLFNLHRDHSLMLGYNSA